jgi:hypothetical protein
MGSFTLSLHLFELFCLFGEDLLDLFGLINDEID